LRFHPSSIISLTSLLKTQHISLASVSEFEQVQALRLDPVSPNINGMSGDYLMELGQFDKAFEQYRKTVEIDPGNTTPVCAWDLPMQSCIATETRRLSLRKINRFRLNSVVSLGALAYVYGLEGKKSAAERMLPEVKALATKASRPSVVCQVYIGLDRQDEALRWLKKA
jgi:tetratricopeptide (TPR) repeat protein